MPRIGVIIPTVQGRDDHLARCLAAYRQRSDGATLEIITVKDMPSCGEAWIQGARLLEPDFDYVHLTADDLEPHEGWWQPLADACDSECLGAPTVLNPDGTIQSAGGNRAQQNHLNSVAPPDGEFVDFTPIPFMSVQQWEEIGMIPVHYHSDVWVSERGRQLDYPTVFCDGSVFTHHNAHAGRLSTHGRDADLFSRYLSEAVPV